MSRQLDRSLAEDAAAIIAGTFRSYVERFRALTRRARTNFETRDWRAMQRDSGRRFDLYTEAVQEGLDQLRLLLGERVRDRPTWTALRGHYAGGVGARGDAELAATFFNSFTRKIFHTIGVDPAVEFVAAGVPRPPAPDSPEAVVRFPCRGAPLDLVAEVLRAYRFGPPWDDEAGDARRVARAMEPQLSGRRVRALELATPVFFRGKGAYLVGRVLTDRGDLPWLLALANPAGRIVADALLLSEDEVSIVFSFARSYFFVEMERPGATVAFLRRIMPRKPVAELYNAVGCNKHGKTELYQSILHHLRTTDDRFEVAPGQRGMVMSVFMLPGFDVVFKVIKDRFDPPKTVTHQEVRDKYRLVFRHDRAGRLVDAQEFEHLEFDAARFSESLLSELTSAAAETVRLRGDRVVIGHLYTERRLRPLDVHLRENDGVAAREAVIEYGQVLRDLAATNIFPGDMLLKNFGVTRHGRLVFYDYDELCLLTECTFRRLPPPRDPEEETAGEPWFYVGERDIFPEEFRSFLGLGRELQQVFLQHHAELLDAGFWNRMQDLHRGGEVLDIYPYRSSRRLRAEQEDPRS
jgi:isocitrate dehydrogenase kinase/phosphatase